MPNCPLTILLPPFLPVKVACLKFNDHQVDSNGLPKFESPEPNVDFIVQTDNPVLVLVDNERVKPPFCF